jgi:hypothetical protein
MSILSQAIPRPILTRRDPGSPRRIVFEFSPDDLTQEASSTWADVSSLGREHPVQQFVRGNLETITFTARLFARHQAENIRDTIEALKRSVKADRKLGRPPIFDFVWGLAVVDVVVVQSVGGVRITSIRPNGTVRDATLSITLRHYEPYTLAKTDPDARQRDTFYLRAGEGVSWESVARDHYGDALMGEFLRRLSPEMPFLRTGALVKVLKRERFDGLAVTPTSIPLRRTDDGIALRIASFARLGTSKPSVIVR